MTWEGMCSRGAALAYFCVALAFGSTALALKASPFPFYMSCAPVGGVVILIDMYVVLCSSELSIGWASWCGACWWERPSCRALTLQSLFRDKPGFVGSVDPTRISPTRGTRHSFVFIPPTRVGMLLNALQYCSYHAYNFNHTTADFMGLIN